MRVGISNAVGVFCWKKGEKLKFYFNKGSHIFSSKNLCILVFKI